LFGLGADRLIREERAANGSDARVIGRRDLLLAVGATTIARQAAAALPVPPSDSLGFRLVRHGDDIGRHTLRFETKGDTLTVRVSVEARVTLLSIPVVRYTHQVVETWEHGMLSAITGRTDKNGRTEWVNAHRTADGLVVQGSRTQEYVAPEAAIGTSYWDKHMLDGPMISMEDGVLLRPKVTQLGSGPIPLASGGTVQASHYNLSGSFNVDIWYDQTNTWASLAFTVADGSDVHYERL
jgi:hypothetical protein